MPGVGLGQIGRFSFLYCKASSVVEFYRVLSVVLVIVTAIKKKLA